jgi:hypothetical protein
MAPISPEEWSIDQRAAVAADLDQQSLDVIDRPVRSSRELGPRPASPSIW